MEHVCDQIAFKKNSGTDATGNPPAAENETTKC